MASINHLTFYLFLTLVKEAAKQDAFSNPFVQVAFSPSKLNSFKSVAMQAQLAQIPSVMSPQKDKTVPGEAKQVKPRTSFAAMLLKRTSSCVSPTKARGDGPERSSNLKLDI